MKQTIKKVLVANRGEIALRVMRTCYEMGIRTVAIYSTPDAKAPHVKFADESVWVGEAASSESYLDMDKVIGAAKQTDADAIHPGYGFLSENGEFSNRVKDEGIIFIGPSAESMRLMGDKTAARDLMGKAGVPCPPGTKDAMEDVEKALSVARNVGFPVLIKAAAGGGGKGMRIVHDEKDFTASVKSAQSEARNAFGDDRVYVEKYLEEPRHIEFQILADRDGNTVHLFERECSVQRRHQKVIEEAPSSLLTSKLRDEMADAAVKAAKACNYEGAGTIEFLVDKHQKFYFLEMNTRLQVEHPVTEMITGIDLVRAQIEIAEGKPLPFQQNDIQKNGHAIECRVYAEDPSDQFLPSTGTLTRHRIPAGAGVRVDSGVEEGGEVTINYDPMISKLSVHSATRKLAIKKMLRALHEYEISGCRTTIPFCEFTLKHDAFSSGQYDTHFVKDHFDPVKETMFEKVNELDALAASLVAALHEDSQGSGKNGNLKQTGTDVNQWWSNRR
ncbi:acetyl-CoA carboxylase biotin carboxylase subunit [Rhodohalobacter sp. SW132]|uniref:acetyl-CoA carboxylase biotin carboxylase subunit n=1 Tax=Rhodohalobacter sp. SW132 TaxID=2293433 RepID=UPI000E24A585|nr:acetyl-CoA carboxylase biotin carboxylase subunit [Rhodohalobacter sp. SW132]REL38328.1 acetyl-CoA carboxylase biotin carboxylase subunit [Rhodohalobacter sp. SW132]